MWGIGGVGGGGGRGGAYIEYLFPVPILSKCGRGTEVPCMRLSDFQSRQSVSHLARVKIGYALHRSRKQKWRQHGFLVVFEAGPKGPRDGPEIDRWY